MRNIFLRVYKKLHLLKTKDGKLLFIIIAKYGFRILDVSDLRNIKIAL